MLITGICLFFICFKRFFKKKDNIFATVLNYCYL